MNANTEKKLLKRIRGCRRGSVFVPNLFLDRGTRAAIDKALSRLTADGTIRRLARGVYDYPKTHPTIGLLSPAPDAVAKAIAGRDRTTLQPTGAYAANLLRLSEQIPARIVYLTNGPARSIRIGKMTIQLRQTTQRNMATAGRLSGLIIQAFRYLGKEYITTGRITTLNQCPIGFRDITQIPLH